MTPEMDKLSDQESPKQPLAKTELPLEPGVKWCEYGQHYLQANLENFGANRYSDDGLSSWCREHNREYDRRRSKDHEAQKKRRKELHKETKAANEMVQQIAGMNKRGKAGKNIPHVDEIMEAYWSNITKDEFAKRLADETRNSTGMGFQKNADLVIRATGQVASAGSENTDDMTVEDLQREIREAFEEPQLVEETAGPEFPEEDETNQDDQDEISRAS